MKGYIRFSLSSGEIGNTLSIKMREVLRLPDNSLIFHTRTHNNIPILLIRSDVKFGKDGFKRCKVSIFDMPSLVSYRQTCAFLFTAFNINRTASSFEVKVVSDGESSYFGNLKVDSSGVVMFNNEVIPSNKSSVLLTKAMILDGRR